MIYPYLNDVFNLSNWPYLDNFLTNPYHIFTYSGDSDPDQPEYTKKVQHLVRKLSRYDQIQSKSHYISTLIKFRQFQKILFIRIQNCSYLDNFLTNPIYILPYSSDSDPESPEYHKIWQGLLRKLSRYGRFLIQNQLIFRSLS